VVLTFHELVLSDKVKGLSGFATVRLSRLSQVMVWVEKLNENEPLNKCRK